MAIGTGAALSLSQLSVHHNTQLSMTKVLTRAVFEEMERLYLR